MRNGAGTKVASRPPLSTIITSGLTKILSGSRAPSQNDWARNWAPNVRKHAISGERMRQPASLRQDETETKKAEKPVKNGDFRPKEAVRVGFEPTVDRSPH